MSDFVTNIDFHWWKN